MGNAVSKEWRKPSIPQLSNMVKTTSPIMPRCSRKHRTVKQRKRHLDSTLKMAERCELQAVSKLRFPLCAI